MTKRTAIIAAAAVVLIAAGVALWMHVAKRNAPLAAVEDPLSFMPDDAAVVLEMDLGKLENDAVYRALVLGLWDEKSCIAPILLSGIDRVAVSMPDAMPDERMLPMAAVALKSADTEKTLDCLAGEIFAGMGMADEQEYRGVSHFGYPGRSSVRLGVVNERMLVIGDRDGIRRMLDSALDARPGEEARDRFADIRARLPEGAQVRLLAVPGPNLRAAARTRVQVPWSGAMDAQSVVAGMVFSPSGLRISGASVTMKDPALVARACTEEVERVRGMRFLKMLGIANLLAGVHFRAGSGMLLVEATAPAGELARLIEGTGKLVDLGLQESGP